MCRGPGRPLSVRRGALRIYPRGRQPGGFRTALGATPARAQGLACGVRQQGGNMSVIQVGLVDTTGKLDPQLVQATAAALNLQVLHDLPQYWNVSATVQYLPDPKNLPVGVWPVLLVASLPPGEGGVHQDRRNQPYAQVIATPGSADWTIDASHETVEMLVDPAGNRLQVSTAITITGEGVQDANGQFEYLVEACDPCEGNQYAYNVQGIAVSDFITPHFYDETLVAGTRYSFAGNIQRPRQILPGGYISFVNPQSDEWEQILFLGSRPQLRKLGPAQGQNLRIFVDNQTCKLVHESRKPDERKTRWFEEHRRRLAEDARQRGGQFEALLRR
jgi:hypothetical protein